MTVSVVVLIFLVAFFLALMLIWGILLFVYVREKSITPAKEFFLERDLSRVNYTSCPMGILISS